MNAIKRGKNKREKKDFRKSIKGQVDAFFMGILSSCYFAACAVLRSRQTRASIVIDFQHDYVPLSWREARALFRNSKAFVAGGRLAGHHRASARAIFVVPSAINNLKDYDLRRCWAEKPVLLRLQLK